MNWAFTLPSHFTPVSHWVSKSIQSKLGVPAEKISVIYDGLELDGLDPATDGQAFRSLHHLSENDFAVGLVGLLIPWKGQEIFLDAANVLKEKIPNLKMLIIGGTPNDCIPFEKTLKERVKAEQLESTVLFTGHANDMPQVYNGLDVVVSASTSPEPLGTVVIEAMAMGRPLIGPNHGGAAEMMSHNKTGLLFEAKNADGLAESITDFYHSKEKRKQIGQAARCHALATFAVHTHTKKIQDVYTKLLG